MGRACFGVVARKKGTTMAVSIGINGFGRIGRLVLRAIAERGRDDVVPVAINDLGSVEANAHLLRYDSVHGRFPGEVEVKGDAIIVYCRGRSFGPIKVSAEKDPTKVPFKVLTSPWSAPGTSPRRRPPRS
jgi:glyceraldehyde 3-phosphate dehydrogenase